jgi:hypothetical protein
VRVGSRPVAPVDLGIAELHTARLDRRQRLARALRDPFALLLSDSGVNVQHERIDVRPKRRTAPCGLSSR